MKKMILAGLVLLVAACSSKEEEPPIQYGAPASPNPVQQSAAATAGTTLSQSLTFAPTTEPSTGAMGLGDRLVGTLGGYQVAKTMPTPQPQKLAASAVSQAIDTGGLDPACVTQTATSVAWNGCVVEDSSTDPYTGDTTSMRVTVGGTLEWNPATGVTTWKIHETMAMTESSSGQTTRMDVTADLGGTITVTASRIVADTTSNVHLGMSMNGGARITAGIATTLALDLDYQPAPFCVTSGSLVVEQHWTERPVGATAADAPNQGWRFDWTGCNQFTVAYGRS